MPGGVGLVVGAGVLCYIRCLDFGDSTTKVFGFCSNMTY